MPTTYAITIGCRAEIIGSYGIFWVTHGLVVLVTTLPIIRTVGGASVSGYASLSLAAPDKICPQVCDLRKQRKDNNIVSWLG